MNTGTGTEVVETIQQDAGLAGSISLGNIRAAINLIDNDEPQLAMEVLRSLEVLLAVRQAVQS